MSVPDSEDHAEAIREVAIVSPEHQGCNPTSKGRYIRSVRFALNDREGAKT